MSKKPLDAEIAFEICMMGSNIPPKTVPTINTEKKTLWAVSATVSFLKIGGHT